MFQVCVNSCVCNAFVLTHSFLRLVSFPDPLASSAPLATPVDRPAQKPPHLTSSLATSDDDFFKTSTLNLIACPFAYKRKELLAAIVSKSPTPLTLAQLTHLLSLLNFSEERLLLLELFMKTVDDATTTHAQLESKLLLHFLFFGERERAKEIIAGDIL